MTTVCAIYTRKSTDEGLDREVNSLQVQRHLCRQFLESRSDQGWSEHCDTFDDGGFTGANMERPGLQRLLGRIDERAVNIVLVHKIDRLTRSLSDFVKIVDRFERSNVAFVSVTQAFDTSTSMGRLFLNVLLSFAQFEREITSERIRDNIAHSRARGLYTGGIVPLGYEVRDGRFVVDHDEAKVVRFIFDRFLADATYIEIAKELNERGWKTKARKNHGGNSWHRNEWTAAPVAYLLRNRTYLGEALHKEKSYPRSHQPIVSAPVFKRAQVEADKRMTYWRRQRTVDARAALTGLMFDDNGNKMSPVWRFDGERSYCKFVSMPLLRRRVKSTPGTISKVLASPIEDLVLRCLNAICGRRLNFGLDGGARGDRGILRRLVDRIVVCVGRLDVHLRRGEVDTISKSKPASRGWIERIADATVNVTLSDLVVSFPVNLRLPRHARRLEYWDEKTHSGDARGSQQMLADLVAATRWRRLIERGKVSSFERLAARSRCSVDDVQAKIWLAFLAPNLQKAIVEGRIADAAVLRSLSRIPGLFDWRKQRAEFGLVENLGVAPSDRAFRSKRKYGKASPPEHSDDSTRAKFS